MRRTKRLVTALTTPGVTHVEYSVYTYRLYFIVRESDRDHCQQALQK